MSTTISRDTYRAYLRGYVEALAKVTTPTIAKTDDADAAALLLGWRDALGNADPKNREALTRAVELLIS